MASLREYFQVEFGYGKLDSEVTFSHEEVIACKAIARLYLAFDEYVCFLGYYVDEENATLEKMQILIAQHEDSIRLCRQTVHMTLSNPLYDPVGVSSTELPFTGRIFMYVDAALTDQTRHALIQFGSVRGLRVQIRDKSYEELKNKDEKPLAFLSHDSRDKPFVEQLATELHKMLCPVWYDASSLKPGDSLRESIDAGLRDSKRCVVILSHNFFTNPGWGKGEFNAAMNRHFNSGGNVLIPIWHGVTQAEVADYSTLVADIVAINSNVGVAEVVRRLYRVLTADEAYPR